MTTAQIHAYPIPDDVPTDPVKYDKWLRAKVQEALDDPRPGIPHEEVMAQMRTLLERKRQEKANKLS